MVFVGLAVVGHRFHGFVGHVMGFVWWVIGIVVMPWVWWVIGFGSCLGVGFHEFYFCGCGLIFLGSCGADFGGCSGGLCEVVVDWWWWWVVCSGGCDCYLL